MARQSSGSGDETPRTRAKVSPDTAAEMTPMMRQYHAIKDEVPDTLLLFRLGDFYEMFFDDAVTASRELEITLTSRQNAVPMCGVPYHAAEGYIARLLRKGYKVAICDQTEPPRKGVKLVPRKVTRVITPGTVTDMSVLRPGENNFLLGLVESGDRLGAAFLDLSTGEFRSFEGALPGAADRLRLDVEHFRPREVVFPRSSTAPEFENCVPSPVDDWTFDRDTAERLLKDQFGTASLDGFGCGSSPLAVAAAGALVHYARQTQKSGLEHVSGFRCDTTADYMILDASSIRNLELIESAQDGSRKDTMLDVIDRTTTGMGARLLRHWLVRPSIDAGEILERQDAVEELVGSTAILDALREPLAGLPDMERLLGKVAVGTATPRELVSLRTALSRLPALGEALAQLKASRFARLGGELDRLDDLHDLLARAIGDEPPVTLNDGGVIRDGYNADLDELRGLAGNSKSYLMDLEKRERERTGVASLKVRYNRVFGYYIEISKTNLHLAPEEYIRKQTLANAERFITGELKEYEDKILSAEERIVAIEKRLFAEVRDRVASSAPRIRRSAAVVAQSDVLAGFADLARRFDYTRPEISTDRSLMVRGGRHPVLEALAEEHRAERFVPNDLFMDEARSTIHLITGPNMGGKSTFLRQTALIVIMAQMGSFVPARLVRFPIVDRVFTRIGASDNLARGRSTFMVEMTEAAIILNAASPDSLIILDEIGRGTATYDGLSIAWAVVEHIQAHIGAKTLFATHYHELTELADLLSGVGNYHVTVKETENKILFLRKVEEGAADRSYGIEVARLAGMPPEVVDRAREILKKHEESEQELSDNLTVRARRKKHIVINQLALFTPEEAQIRERLGQVDLDHTSPMDALKILAELKDQAGTG
jgi:DNA mismatch repair protein MutS